ncbi:MFS transporter [Gordonia hydrophobica]|uniref:MFS transporter n=1 Tax=Gordonia hydrophobica TaxID=40516 RepID=A0ABZ2U552_9ACTN|nr:MFS transporter [Gordonia hydrophobica]MBM7368691.1 MFS family permease [Gordonia hydrophobica]
MTSTTPRDVELPAQQVGSRLPAILLLLFASGWGANHFAAVLPILQNTEDMSRAALDGAFGVYALGLLPCLLGGGSVSDRVGRRIVVLIGAATAGLGNFVMIFWHVELGVFVGRFVVGLGVGLAVSAGTAWTAEVAGKKGAVLAGAVLTSGFAVGPFVSAIVASTFPSSAEYVSFAVSAGLSELAVAAGVVWTTSAPIPQADVAADDRSRHQDAAGVGLALRTSLPLAIWVFSTVTASIVVLAARMTDRFGGPMVPGVASLLALGGGLVIQMIARRLDWGAYAGIAGIGLAVLGFGAAAVAGPHPSIGMFVAASLMLGAAYGLCLREGLINVELHTPPTARGMVTGIFYVFTYLGFGLPVLMATIEQSVGGSLPLVVLAVLAACSLGVCLRQIRTGTVNSRNVVGIVRSRT